MDKDPLWQPRGVRTEVGGGKAAEGPRQSLGEGGVSVPDSVLQPEAGGCWPSPPGQGLSTELPSRCRVGVGQGLCTVCVRRNPLSWRERESREGEDRVGHCRDKIPPPSVEDGSEEEPTVMLETVPGW